MVKRGPTKTHRGKQEMEGQVRHSEGALQISSEEVPAKGSTQHVG
jgi:hypothetical protein